MGALDTTMLAFSGAAGGFAPAEDLFDLSAGAFGLRACAFDKRRTPKVRHCAQAADSEPDLEENADPVLAFHRRVARKAKPGISAVPLAHQFRFRIRGRLVGVVLPALAIGRGSRSGGTEGLPLSAYIS